MTNKHISFGMLLSLLPLVIVSSESYAASKPTVTISANPTTVASGGRSLMTWSSTNATTCTRSGTWSGTETHLSDSGYTADLTANVTYVLTCTGPGGSASASATVTVGKAPTVTISANPKTVTSGGRSLMTWSTTNATACTRSGAWSGTETHLSDSGYTADLTADVTYVLTCTGPGGRASDSATVSVTATPVSGDATLSWKAPTTNTNGTPVIALKGYHLYYGNSAAELTKSIAISGATTTSYEITGLTAGTWYFAVAADAADGTESAKSSIGSTTI